MYVRRDLRGNARRDRGHVHRRRSADDEHGQSRALQSASQHPWLPLPRARPSQRVLHVILSISAKTPDGIVKLASVARSLHIVMRRVQEYDALPPLRCGPSGPEQLIPMEHVRMRYTAISIVLLLAGW